MVRTIVVAANGSGKKCITWKTANTEALLESGGKGAIFRRGGLLLLSVSAVIGAGEASAVLFLHLFLVLF